MGMAGSVSGALPQTRVAEADKSQQQAADQARQATSNEKAEQAAGVGETEHDEQASDRDADGRRLWEETQPAHQDDDEPADVAQDPHSRDPSGQRGANLDLSG